MTAVEMEGLVKRFGRTTAVDGVSFRVERGEAFCLLGPNGAGKTTTMHILATLLRPTAGRARVAGFDVVSEAGEVRRRIGVVFQEPSVDGQLTAYENMYIHGRLYGMGGRELRRRIEELLRFVDLWDYRDRRVRYFSGGMRRRLEVARALLHGPEVLLLDEPTLGLDPQARARLWDHIDAARRGRGVTVLMTTHYMDEAEQLCGRIAIMDRGRVIAEGTAEGLKSMVGGDVIYVRTSDGRCFDSAVGPCRAVGGRLEFAVKDAAAALPVLLEELRSRGFTVQEVSYRRPTLNEVFLHLTGRELRDGLEKPAFQLWR